jgi:solute carrier family 10 (sodium/bile acid cotransporter), member 7
VQSILNAVAKRWFLLAVLLGFAIVWFWPGAMGWTTAVQPRLVIPLALFLIAWTMDSQRLFSAVRKPGPALLAVAIGFTLPPLVAWGSGTLLPLADLHIGLLICACVPCTLASAVIWTRLAGGDEAQALLASFASSGLSWLVTPAWLAATTGNRITLDLPSMMLDLAGTLLLPVVLGQAARAVPLLGRLAAKRRRLLGIVSQLLVLAIMFRAAFEVAGMIRAEGSDLGALALVLTIALCLGNHLIALAAGWWGAGWLGVARPARMAVAFAGSQKTLPVSLMLWQLYYPGYLLAVVPLLVYHAGQLIVDTFIADRWANRASQASPEKATPPAPADWV